MVPGSQMQVMGAATHAASTRLFLNERFVDVAPAYERRGIAGAEIGRYPWSPGAPGSWGVFDLYELVVFSPGLSDADALGVSQALMAAHEIVPVTNQLVLEGDSIMGGTGEVTPARSASMILTEPGASLVPPGWRVTNKAQSGNRLSDLVTRRDSPDGWPETRLTGGRNVLAFEIGRNDWTAGGTTAAQLVSGVQSYLGAPGSGVLDRGWEVRVMANIAGPSGLMPTISEYRAALRDPGFLDAMAAGPGQPFDGKVSVVATDLIEVGGDRIFFDAADSSEALYYAGDRTHPTLVGSEIRLTGGDTPQHAVTADL